MDICICINGSLCCTSETNTVLRKREKEADYFPQRAAWMEASPYFKGSRGNSP